MTGTQTHTAPDAAGNLRGAVGRGVRKLLAQLGELFRSRAPQHAGLYLPLVRIDRGD